MLKMQKAGPRIKSGATGLAGVWDWWMGLWVGGVGQSGFRV